MTARQDKIMGSLLAGSLGGAALLFALLTWYLWRESVIAEEHRIRELARSLGEQTETAIIDARDMLERFNGLDVQPCSNPHLRHLQEAAVSRPYIRAVGYWQAADRLCGVGFVQGIQLTPRRADKIYESGVVAWWPGPETAIGDVQLFLMRYGEHDVAIDPRLLLEGVHLDGQKAGLWVEGLPMATMPPDSKLPAPDTLDHGLTVDGDNNRILSRFSLGELLPIDIVAVQPMSQFWKRYLPGLFTAALLGLGLLGVWVYAIMRYSRHRLSLATELRNAIANGDITAAYQPVMDLESGRCRGAEALARWCREDGEMVSPEVFIPAAEEAGLVSDLTLSILKQTLRDLSELLRDFPDLSINVNLSSHDLESDRLPARIADCLTEANMPASVIKLEITERALIDTEIARDKIRGFRASGHQVAIDDFGTGYSSLSYLESFELDTLKIDKAFVDAIDSRSAGSGLITHVIEMARSLHLEMVAEGIESGHQAEWLRDQGVKYGQGFYFSRPLPARQFIRFLRRHG
jgi:sensor c-di-GMP phosphodiesterase-like protein